MSYGYGSSVKYDDLIGKTVESITLSSDKESLQLNFADQTAVRFDSEGDCCSHTWIEHVQGVRQIVGYPITKIEAIDLPNASESDGDWGDVIDFYGLRIESPVGALVVDYRNSNNGYYGGWLNLNSSSYDETPTDALTEDV